MHLARGILRHVTTTTLSCIPNAASFLISLGDRETSDDRAKRHLRRCEVDHTPEEKREDDKGDQSALDEEIHD